MAEQANGSEPGWVYRDKDPPPGYSGENPQSTFKGYMRDLELWKAGTDVPAEKQGLKLVQVLSGAAKSAVEVLTVEEIKGADGYANVVKKLKAAFAPYVETALPRALEAALYGHQRSRKETLTDYLIRFQKSQAQLQDGVTLPPKAAGYLLYRQANLDHELDARLTTWLAGDFSLDNVTANLRRLERVSEEEVEESYAEPNLILYDKGGWHEDLEDDDPNFVYLQEGDLDEVLERTRRRTPWPLTSRSGSRLRTPGLGGSSSVHGRQLESPVRRGGKGHGGKGKLKQGKPGAGKPSFGAAPRRVHIEELKLRTRCKACGQVGHWAQECRQRPSAQATASSSSSSAAPSSQRTSFYWRTGDDSSSSSAAFLTGVEPERSGKEVSQAQGSELSSFIGVALEDRRKGSLARTLC